MRTTTSLLICLGCLIAAVPATVGQEANSHVKPGILGYLDPHTGAFRPVTPAIQDEDELPPATTITGTVSVTITITVKTATLKSFTCSIDVSTFDGTTSPVASA